MSEGFSFMLLFALLLLTAFFVASEFAIVKVRRSKIDHLIEMGSKRAVITKEILEDLDGYLSACQLGITITSLGLGWIGESAFEKVFHDIFIYLNMPNNMQSVLSFSVAFACITFLHVVLGELVPKSLAIQKAEAIALLVAKPLKVFKKIMFPFIWVLNGTAITILKTTGMHSVSDDENHTEEEIKMIVSNSTDINDDEQILLNKVLNFDDKILREVMVHRKDMVCLYLEDTYNENIRLIKDSKHSRFPVLGEDRDDVKGYVYLKDLFSLEASEDVFGNALRDVPRLYEGTLLKSALKRLQGAKHQMAIVVDEYGGVAGLVTIEDIIEEIFGNIQDEYDDDKDKILKVKNDWIVDADAPLSEFNEVFETDVEADNGVDTIGGYLMTIFNSPFKIGMCHYIDEKADIKVTIVECEEHYIKKIKVEKLNKNL